MNGGRTAMAQEQHESIIDLLQAGHRREQPKADARQPNRQWAYRHLIAYARGEHRGSQQVLMSARACDIGEELMAQIIECRRRAK